MAMSFATSLLLLLAAPVETLILRARGSRCQCEVKGVWMNLATVIFDYGGGQYICLNVVSLGYFIFTFAIKLWRIYLASILDIAILAVNAFVFVFGFILFFAALKDETLKSRGLTDTESKRGAESLAVYGFIIWEASKRIHEKSFRMSWKFLFVKFRSTTFWWSILLLIKGVWMNLAAVIFDYGVGQNICLNVVSLGYFIFTFAIKLWRIYLASILDITILAVNAFMFGFIQFFAALKDETLKSRGLTEGEINMNDLGMEYQQYLDTESKRVAENFTSRFGK